MKGINLTLLIQMIHFGIAYLILKKILLEKGYAVVCREHEVDVQLGNAVQHEQELVAKAYDAKQAHWQAARENLMQYIPQWRLGYMRHEVPSLVVQPPEKEQQRILEQKLTAIISERVLHDS